MKSKKIVATLSVTIVLLFLVGCNIMNGWSINVKKGDKYNLHEVVDQKVATTLHGLNVNTEQVMDMNLTMEVQDVDKDKNVTLSYKYDSIKVSTEDIVSKKEYDSKNPDSNNPLADTYGAVVGKGFTVKVSKKGQVLETKGADELLNSIFSKLSGDNQTDAVKNTLKQNFGEDAIKSMVSQSINYQPSNRVKVNDTWENKYNIMALYPMEASNKFKLLSEKDGLLTVDVQSTVADTKGKQVQFMATQADMELKGDCKGMININKKTGLMAKGDFIENMSGDMDVTLDGKNVKIPTEISTKTTYETTKK